MKQIIRLLELNKGHLARLADSSATGQYNDKFEVVANSGISLKW